VRRIALALALVLGTGAAAAQTLYRCTTADRRVTYQDTACPVDRGQKRLDLQRPESRDEAQARLLLELEAARGSDLARRFADDARSREIDRLREREAMAREERLRRLKEAQDRPAEDVPWNTPWGFPARPGQARPQPKPSN
jgi:predicted ArsR family transcriptional regulator